jgi:hypothetical protein
VLREVDPVNEQLPIDTEALVEEVGRYLAAVDLFRAVECEPTWRPEPDRLSAAPDLVPARAPRTPSAH